MKVKRIAGFELALFILPLPLYCGGRMRKISVETPAVVEYKSENEKAENSRR